jgi:tRNA dimethylallyltransferase
LIAVLGPTGSGKSDLALFLAERLGGEIVNCDSIQVYRGLDIGSAKLPPEKRKGIRHHLIDVIEPDGELTAGVYSRLARQILEDIRLRERIPIVAGGTGFYLRALLDGLSPAPGRDPDLRIRLAALARRRPGALHRFLRRRDPASAARIHPNDHQKLIRAIELTALAGRPASQTQSEPHGELRGFTLLKLGLAPERAQLYRNLDERSAAMFRSGLLDETKSLLQAGISPRSKALQSLGYKQAVQVLSRELTLDAGIAECRTKTRQYAKRQMTWFRSEAGVHWLYGFGGEEYVQSEALTIAIDFISR